MAETVGKKSNPQIYVASLADYNAGRLIGRWIEVTQDADHVRTQIQEMLKESKEPFAEEWAIHDYSNFHGLDIGEYSDIETLVQVATLIEEHGPVFAELVNHCGGLGQLEEANTYMEDGYRGAFSSLEEYAQELIEDCYADVLNNLPDFIRLNIDYEGIARDMELGGDVFTIECEHKVHVFDSHV